MNITTTRLLHTGRERGPDETFEIKLIVGQHEVEVIATALRLLKFDSTDLASRAAQDMLAVIAAHYNHAPVVTFGG